MSRVESVKTGSPGAKMEDLIDYIKLPARKNPTLSLNVLVRLVYEVNTL